MKLAALTKNVKCSAVAVLVHLAGEVGELVPALELGAIVERHDDELRRAIDAGVRRRHDPWR